MLPKLEESEERDLKCSRCKERYSLTVDGICISCLWPTYLLGDDNRMWRYLSHQANEKKRKQQEFKIDSSIIEDYQSQQEVA